MVTSEGTGRTRHRSHRARSWARPRPDIPAGASCGGTLGPMANVRLFASAREAAGRGRDELPGSTVDEVLRSACDRYGQAFTEVLSTCRVWVNGESVPEHTPVGPDDEVAVLPPVSGGATEPAGLTAHPGPLIQENP
jgi:sulfur-carrier protein